MKTQSLDQINKGENCEMLTLKNYDNKRFQKLSSYGLVPGSKIFLSRKTPSFVIKIGETNLAFSREIAQEILVKLA